MEKKGSSSPSAGGGPPPPPPDSLHGLKFGKKIYFEGNRKSGGAETALPPSPAKKGRSVAVQGGQPPRCQVEGCMVDLSDAKAYYSRHKVCGMHSKSPMVIVSGLHKRFCQQCSRFHQLPEFDQGKRSCRRRLAGHNERRRKPPPGPLLSPRYRTLSPSIFENPTTTRGFVMDFSSYPNPTLTGRDSGLGNHQLPWPGYLGPGSSSQECFHGVSFSGSASALSLLSNQPWASKAQSPSLGVNNQFGTNSAHMVQPSVNPGAAVGQFAWGFKDNNQGSSEMRPVLGLGQTSSGELGLGQPNEGQFHELDHSRGYDLSIQHMHWSL